MKVLFTPSARVQFLTAVETIRRNNQAAARRFRLQAGKSLKRLERFPRSGAVIPEFPELSYREIYVKPCRFFYRVREDTVWIVALWHGAQIPDEPEDT
ncbi:MAG: type II toxin-antitoxin system RelE/ParE family toxin [Isosphaerales bacterium]